MRDFSRRGVIGSARAPRPPSGLAGCGTAHVADGSNEAGGSGNGAAQARHQADAHRHAPSVTAPPPTPASSRTSPASPCRWSPARRRRSSSIFSWDGAGEVGNGLFPRFLELAKEHDAHMTFFLSGLYLLPESKKRLYDPPNNAARRLRHRLPHRRAHQGDAEERPPGLARRPRDRHPLQRPLLRRLRHRRQLDARSSGAARSTRPSPSSRSGAPTPAGPTCPRCPSTTTRNSSAAARPVCSARTTCCPPPASSAGATTPPRPAAARCGPRRSRGIWDLPLQAIPFPGHTLRGPLDGLQHPRQPVDQLDQGARLQLPGLARAGDRGVHRRDSSGHTRRTARPSSSATTSSSGTAASTWTPSRRPSSTSRGRRRRAPTSGSSPSGSSSTGWTCRSPEVLAKLRTLEVGQQPVGGWKTFLEEQTRGSRAPARAAPKRRLKCGFPPARGVRKIPGTGMRNFSHECRQPRPLRSNRSRTP